MRIGLLLMASGLSRRMGSNKLLLPWRGGTIFSNVLGLIKAVMAISPAEIVPLVVIGKASTSLRQSCEAFSMDYVLNEDPKKGQSYTVHVAIAHWQACHQLETLDGILCMVGDQPLLTKEALCNLINAFDGERHSIVCPYYETRPGNPVLFGSYWFNALGALEGDQGGRAIVRGPGSPYITYVNLPSYMGIDIDEKETYEKVCSIDVIKGEI